MTNMTRDDIIGNNNFEMAKTKYENATPRWMNYWWEACEIIYKKCKDLAKKYILDPINKVIKEVQKIFFGVDWNGFDALPEGTEQFYLIELLNNNGRRVWSKIGTTTRATFKRMNEHLKNSTYRANDVSAIKIVGLWNCGNVEAQIIESRVRKYLRKFFDNKYIPNDRFEIDFDLPALTKKVEQFIAFENSCEI